MKKKLVMMLCTLLCCTMVFTACGAKEKKEAPVKQEEAQKQEEVPETEPEKQEEPPVPVDSEDVTDPEVSNLAYEAEEAVVDETIIPGSSQADAVQVPIGTKVYGTVEKRQHAWLAFTTGDTPGTTYNITLVSATTQTRELLGGLYDEFGKKVGNVIVSQDGVPKTISSNTLEANTVYYVKLSAQDNRETIRYTMIVKDPNGKAAEYETKENLAEARGSDNLQEEEIIAGTNQSASALLPFEVNASGTVENNESAWFAFTTGEGTKSTYKITVINTTANSGDILGELYDEYGTKLGYGRANGDGTACAISSDKLKENTTYYVGLKSGYSNETINYTISVKSSEKKEPEKPLVFEVPFEINETQVRFVANKAVFIDEAKAKEVLKPVAEAILKYPDHAVMIAGTTATAGTQQACVELSVKRAEAVKRLLVKTYGVPESQLKIAGLGYELDPFERGKDKKANGEFVETEARKNRRVVIMDIDDPAAQNLMKYAK